MVCAHAGMERPLPFSAFSFDKPYMASRNDQGMIVVDKYGDRLLFLDASGVSKSEIANLFALGNVILYAFKDTLIFGAGTCCLILGIFFAISGVMHYLITRKRGDFA